MGAARRVAAVFAAVGMTFVLVWAAPASVQASPDADADHLVVIGTAGLRWQDITEANTPHLWRLVENGAVAANVSRSVPRVSCPLDGWLALSAGRRLAAPSTAPLSPAAESASCSSLNPAAVNASGVPTEVWSSFRDAGASQSFGAVPGVLGDSLNAAGISSTAFGPGAAIALSASDGSPAGDLRTLPAGHADLADALAGALASSRFILIDAGGLAASPQRPSDLAALDAQLGAILQGIQTFTADADSSSRVRVLTISLADDGATADLQFAAQTDLRAGEFDGPVGFLHGASTRTTGLIQTTDVLAFVLAGLGIEASGPAPVGSAWQPPATSTHQSQPPATQSVADRVKTLQQMSAHARATAVTVPSFMIFHRALALLAVGLGLVLLRTVTRQDSLARLAIIKRRRVILALTAVTSAHAAAYLSNTVPWWAVPAPRSWLGFAGLFLIAWSFITWLTLRPWWGRSRFAVPGISGLIICGILLADLVTNNRLSASSPLGSQPIDAGRFYGFNNAAFALLLCGVFLAAAWGADVLKRRGRAWLAVVGIGGVTLVAAVVDASPSLGADVGGAPGIVLAGALLALWVGGVGVRWRHVAISAGVGVVIIGGLAWWDYLRPVGERTHLGDFVASVLSGADAAATVWRKVELNLLIAGLTLLGLLAAGMILWLVGRMMRWRFPSPRTAPLSWPWWKEVGAALRYAGEREPLLRHTAFSLGAGLLLGSLINDSGIYILLTGVIFAGPVLLIVAIFAGAHPGDQAIDSAADGAAGAAEAAGSNGKLHIP